jgi:hypothetical protein
MMTRREVRATSKILHEGLLHERLQDGQPPINRSLFCESQLRLVLALPLSTGMMMPVEIAQ